MTNLERARQWAMIVGGAPHHEPLIGKEIVAQEFLKLEAQLAIARASRFLDGIKFELYASVYTLTDDEFEKTFAARDLLDDGLRRMKEVK